MKRKINKRLLKEAEKDLNKLKAIAAVIENNENSSLSDSTVGSVASNLDLATKFLSSAVFYANVGLHTKQDEQVES